MRFQSLFLVAMVACLAVGCGSIGRKTERSYSILAAYPVEGKPIFPLTPAGNPVNCPGTGDADACVIPITVTDVRCDAADIVLENFVKLGALADKKRITWTLPLGYYFCPRAGDGVFLKNPNVPDDLFDPMPKSKCSDTFEWKRKKADSNDYEYLVRFRSAAKECGVKDPWARN